MTLRGGGAGAEGEDGEEGGGAEGHWSLYATVVETVHATGRPPVDRGARLG